MSVFSVIGIAGTGATVYRKWLDAVSDNIANLNTVRSTSEAAYQEKRVIAEPMPGGGVQVAGVLAGSSAQGKLVYEPTHPLADADGMVRYPDVDLSSEMTQLIMAQRGYQANLSSVDRAREAYQAALQLGRG
jgi:flagellar basal-body rod protein FlgC